MVSSVCGQRGQVEVGCGGTAKLELRRYAHVLSHYPPELTRLVTEASWQDEAMVVFIIQI